MHSMRSAASTSSLSMKINSSAPRSRSSSTLLGNINVARMVATAFKPGTNAIGPKMLGLKQVKVKGISKSLSDLDETRRQLEEERKMCQSEHSSLYGSCAVFSFVQPTEKKKLTYREQQTRLRKAVAKHEHLQEGTLLDTLEKGVPFPVIHINWNPGTSCKEKFFAPVSTSSSHSSKRKATPQPKLLREDALGPAVHLQQGLYEEVRRIEPDFAFSARDNPDQRAFIILGFKTLDTGFSSVLESTWRDWTGARSIYLKLHNQYDLAKIIFYHRVQPVNDLDLFMYIVVVECWNVHSRNLIHMLDFVQRMRVERLNGYISLYRDLSDQLDEADSNYHSASQESEDERASCTIRSSISPAAPFPEEEEEEEDQGLGGEVLKRRQQGWLPIPPILVTESASETETRTRVVETLTIETQQPSAKITFPPII